jgi:hypothetical protein
MIDQDFSGTEHVIDPQDASSYHFVNSADLSPVPDQNPNLDYGMKPSYGQFPDARQVYQPPLAPYPTNVQYYAPQNMQRPYETMYQAANPPPVDTTGGTQSYQTPEMPPVARTTSDASTHGSSTADGLSEALGVLKIDEDGIGM